MVRVILAGLFALAVLNGCNKFSGFKKSSETTPVATESATSEPAAKKCPNGDAPQVLTGDCSGTYAVKNEEGKVFCDFNWGPPIKCPAGTKSLTYEAVCYGTTRKEVPQGKTVADASDCVASFGQLPQAGNYTLECCP